MLVKLCVSSCAVLTVVALAFAGGEHCRAVAAAEQADAEVAPQLPPPAPVMMDDACSRFVFFAVLEGLYEDGVSNDVVDRAIELDTNVRWPKHFVYACPICMPAFDAFRSYRSRTEFYARKVPGDTFGPGLADDLKQRLLDRDDAVLAKALEELVQRWTSRRIELLRLTEAERKALSFELAERKKRGMESLYAYKQNNVAPAYASMKTCPFCEGASGACPIR